MSEKQKKLIKGLKADECSSSESQRAVTIKREDGSSSKITVTSNGDSKHQMLSAKFDPKARKPSATFQHIKKPIRMEVNRKLNGPALAVRTISGQTKLLVPVSAAAATAKKQNQPKQILVVQTPGGGARLATSAAGPSLLRPQRLDSRYFKNDSNEYTSSSGKHYISNIIDSYHQRQQQLKERYLKAKREEEKIPEKKRKEDYLAALGLLTKQALSEIQNKKYERKRRTTANPQFSNAAIEAKRITAMEIAAKRAKRREMMLAAAEKGTHHRESKRLHSHTASSFSTSSRHPSNNRSLLKSNCEKNSTQFVTKLRPILPIRPFSSSSATTSHASMSSSNLQISRPVRRPKILKKCYVCDELCDPELDAIMLCKECRCFFHATCASTVDDINKTNSVPCPICDKKTSEWSSTPEADLDSFLSHHEKSSKQSGAGVSGGGGGDDDESGEDEGVNRRDKILNQEDEENMKKCIATRSRDQLVNNKSVKDMTSLLSKSKINSNLLNIKKEKKETLLTKQKELNKIYLEDKNKITELNTAFKKLKEDKKLLITEQNKVKESIEKLKNIIKMFQKSNHEDKMTSSGKSTVDSNTKEKLKEEKSGIESNYTEKMELDNQVSAKEETGDKSDQDGVDKVVKAKEDGINLMNIDSEPATADKSHQFEDETSAAVASIQDQMDIDAL